MLDSIKNDCMVIFIGLTFLQVNLEDISIQIKDDQRVWKIDRSSLFSVK